jgi:hypothetical protein
MEKISNAQIAEVMRDAAVTLRHQQAHIGELEEKLAGMERRDRVEKLAGDMHRKGINLDVGVDELADRLEKAAAAGKLETIEQAVDFVGPDMGEKIGQVATNQDVSGTSGSSDLERFIVGGVG